MVFVLVVWKFRNYLEIALSTYCAGDGIFQAQLFVITDMVFYGSRDR